MRNHTYPASSPWLDPGQEKAGLSNDDLPAKPILTVDPTLVTNEPLIVSIARNNAPHFSGCLILGVSELSAPLKGGTLVPGPDVVVGPLSMRGGSALELTAPWAGHLPSGASFWMQAWLHGNGVPPPISDRSAVRGTVP